MQRFSDLAIILKSFPYQDRDRIVVFLTENHGVFKGLAKGAVHSRRFGGSLDFLACSRVRFAQKPHAELARIEEAVSHHEFASIGHDFGKLTAASFAAELCSRMLEPGEPAREMFVLLSNFLHRLDHGAPFLLAINAFLCKVFRVLGYPPSLLRCVQCGRGAHEIQGDGCHWSSQAGGMICGTCASGRFPGPFPMTLDGDTLLLFHKLTMVPFKELAWDELDPHPRLHMLLADFLHHHLPGIPAAGLKSWKLLSELLAGPSPGSAPESELARELDRFRQ